MRTFAIGDIHGCHQHLQALLTAINPTAHDTLIFLGDMIDRGEDSKGVIDTIRHYEKHCHVIAIMGNHEEMMLNALQYQDELKYWLRYGGIETLQSFGQTADMAGLSAVPFEYIRWLDRLKPYHETDDFIFTHAMPEPFVEMAKQGSNGLRWRFITDDDHEHISGKTVICGHTSQDSGKVLRRDGLICVDTHAYAGMNLTALEVHSMSVWQASKIKSNADEVYSVASFAL
ncbi:MAG: metallophosphoesterase family protein [Moraxella sp.]|nr:metallophosphoesterase family protein [Moraxella sp.]